MDTHVDLLLSNNTKPVAETPRRAQPRVTVDGCLVSFNGQGTLWLNHPIPLADVLADPLTQRVRAAMQMR